jgi:HD-like signal output (HDOD) protein
MTEALSSEVVEREIWERVGAGAVKVPPYPSIALRLQGIVDEGNYGLSDLARIVSSDAAVTATVLRLANSGYFRGSARLTTLPDAISRIGAQELCRVALAAALGGLIGAQGPLASLRRSSWRQALGGALVSQVLAANRRLGPQPAFLSGLLHDFGRVVAIAALEEVLHGHPRGSLPEAEWIGLVDRVHVQVGSLVAARWNLPELLVQVIAGHHQPAPSGEALPFIELVRTADEVVALMEDCPYLLRRDFDRVASLRGEREVQTLMQYIPLIPGYISGLEDITGMAGGHGRSAVEPSETALDGPRVDVDFPVLWVRTSGETSFRARYLTPKGIGLAGTSTVHEGSVTRLRVTVDGQTIDLSGRVALARPDGEGHLVEVRLFALPGMAQSWWATLIESKFAAPPG